MISARYQTPVMISRGEPQTLRLDVRGGAGAAVTVTGGTCTVYDRDGATVKTGAVVPVAGVATFALVADDTSGKSYATGWRVSWRVTTADAETVIDQEAHLVRRPLRPVIDAADLSRRHTTLATQYQAAALQVFVDEAFDEIQARLIGEGRYPQHVFSGWAFRGVHLSLALSRVFRDLATYTQGAGRYIEEAERYQGEYDRGWGQLSTLMDRDEDGKPEEMDSAEGVVFLFARPGR